MSWNADNTVWEDVPGYVHSAKLEHLGNGQWRFTSAVIDESLETDGGSEDNYMGKLYVLWEPGVLETYYDQTTPSSSPFSKQTGTYTFSGNGSASIRIGYSYAWNEGSGSPGHYVFTETTISNGQTDNRGNNGSYGTSDENFGITIPEVNPDNPASLQAGDMVGLVMSVDHQDRNSDEDTEDWTQAAFFQNFDTFDFSASNNGNTATQSAINLDTASHPLAYWSFNRQDAWYGVGDNHENIYSGSLGSGFEHTATMGGATYKIRYRLIEKNNIPAGLSTDFSGYSSSTVYGIIDGSTSDSFHDFTQGGSPNTYLKTWTNTSNISSGGTNNTRAYNWIEAYVHEVTDPGPNSGGGGSASSAAASRTFKGSGSVSFTEIKDFLNPEGNIGTTNISLIGMFGSAQTIPATMPNGNFVAPHNVSEFYNASISTDPYLSITSITNSTETAYLAWLASSASSASTAQPALVVPENWVTLTRRWSGYGYADRICHATLTWSAIAGASGYRIRLEERNPAYPTALHPQNNWEYNPTDYEFTTTGTTFGEMDFPESGPNFNYIVTALGTAGESSDSEFPELLYGSRTSFGQPPGGGVLSVTDPQTFDDD